MVRTMTVLMALLAGAEASRFKRGTTEKSWKPKLLPGKIDIKRPAFLLLDEAKDQVMVAQFGRAVKPSTFNPLPIVAQSSISTIPVDTIKGLIGKGRLSGKVGNEALFVNTNSPLQWPNVLSRVPKGYGDLIVVPDGFLPPGKSDGDMFFARPDGSVHRFSTSKKGTFYHEVEWHDFNGDGLLDILTCRVTKAGNVITGLKFSGEMVWFQNPGINKMDKVIWKEHVITTGPDVIFKSKPYKGGLAVFATEFFNPEGPKIGVNFVNRNGELTSKRTIDDSLGKPFAVDITDLDGDGKYELLVTNHQGPDDEILPAIFAYEVDWNNLEKGAFPRTTLTYGPSENKVNNPGVGAPGFAHGFYPKKGMTGPKWIFCAGDGAFDVWILKPKGGKFEYETEIIDIGGTTGQILAHDFNGDGVMDLLIPDNDYWKLKVITFE